MPTSCLKIPPGRPSMSAQGPAVEGPEPHQRLLRKAARIKRRPWRRPEPDAEDDVAGAQGRGALGLAPCLEGGALHGAVGQPGATKAITVNHKHQLLGIPNASTFRHGAANLPSSPTLPGGGKQALR